ncbi:MAG: right-handed parallel beta-helix repeat-containing protein [Lachnospiraceae bacterium]|nr:right-handed parallel beta-helix repeat-containing protein [Lachnospiraceae bacterium]
MKIKKCMAFLAITCMSVMLAGCTSGGTQGSGDPGTETAQTDANTDEGSGQDAAQEDDNAGTDASGDDTKDEDGQDASGDQDSAEKPTGDVKKASEDEAEKLLAGDWVMVKEWYYNYGPEDEKDPDLSKATEDNMYVTLAADEPAEVKLSIYEDGQSYFADYVAMIYESYEEYNHLPLGIEKGGLYKGCENQSWFAKVKSPRSEKEYFYTLIDENTLEQCITSTYDYDDEGTYTYITVYRYLRDGSEELEHADDLRYENTVTVSNAEELLNAIADNTKIILKAGDYDLSAASPKAGSEKVYLSKDHEQEGGAIEEVQIREVTNLRLEAEENAQVEISISDPAYPVLGFYDSHHCSIDGITLGHHVEPGTCGGSVIYINNCDSFSVKGCELYGSGTYGLECNSAYSLTCTDTEIYDCTYGIVDLINCSTAEFTNCRMHDNMDMNMICATQSYGIRFDGCEFYNNYVATEQYSNGSFVYSYDSGEIEMTRCTFRDNNYTDLCNEADKVKTENCRFLN